MSVIIETGIGVYEANTYIPASYVTAYLTARNRETENSWSTSTATVQDSAVISATDYVDKRFAHRFKGVPKVKFPYESAQGEVSFLGLPVAAETLTVGDQTYTFVSSFSTEPENEVLIGSTAAETASNLADAINGTTANAGVTYGTGTAANRHSTATAATGAATLTATAGGTSGAYTALTGSLTNGTLTQFSGGKDGGIQPLCWPRSYAYDDRGISIIGIPEKLKQAIAEYAVRVLLEPLFQDPDTDDYGGPILLRSEAVGPIKETFQYAGNATITKFPAADRLLNSLLINGGMGGVIRA